MNARLTSWLGRLPLKLVHAQALLRHPMTVGVRGIVLDGAGQVFLVRHSYVSGWHLPGGGVEAGETAVEALTRELQEEARIRVDDALLHGVFFNRRASRRDHVLVYVVRAFQVLGPRRPDWEIRGSGFFPLASLPDGTTRATRARLAEVASGTPPPADW